MRGDPGLTLPLPADRRVRDATLVALVGGVAAAWFAVLWGPDGMNGGLIAFLGPWTAMMAAMMMPSAAPFLLLYGRGASSAGVAAVAAGYLAIWAVAGIPAYLAHLLLPMTAGPVALALAGVYQLTPAKAACLNGCRSPADFLVRRWGRGPLRLGVEHGLWCLGCCWALMAVLVLVGSMGLAWVVGLAALVALEKMNRYGEAWARAAGIALIAAAILRGVRSWTGSSMEMS